MKRFARSLAALIGMVVLTGASDRDPANPTCPADPDWGAATPMTLTVEDRGDKRVIIADGMITASLPDRLKKLLESDERISEVWLKSRGGDALAGNKAGKAIRSIPGMTTRIPAGWTCFSACNFVFMGGDRRLVDDGGVFMVHMFTHTGQRDVISNSVHAGTAETVELIGEIEQSSALLASADNDFLIRMGVSRKLLTDIMYQQPAVGGEGNHGTRYCLSQEEVWRYNVENVEGAG